MILHIFTLKNAYDSLAFLKSEFIAGNTEKAMSDITSGVNKYFHIRTANRFAFFLSDRISARFLLSN